MSICSKLIFRRLLIKLAKECTFKFNSRFLKQVDGCPMGEPLSVTFSDIYMVKMENDAVIPSKPISKNFEVSFPKYPQNSILTLLDHDCLCIL